MGTVPFASVVQGSGTKKSLEIRQSKSVEVFKTKLKTLLFKEYYKKKGVCG